MEDFDENKVVGLDDPTLIHPWDAIVDSLIQEVDGQPLVFNELKNLSKSQIGPENFKQIHDARSYFDCIENNFEESDVLTFLINVTEKMRLHVGLGSQKVSDRLKIYKQRLEECKTERQRQGIFSDKDFVGRHDDIKEIIDLLSQKDPIYKGVCICGAGGMGKTSLAREVCFRMRCSKDHWIPKKIELRETTCLKDMLRATLVKLGQGCSSSTDLQHLQQQLFEFLRDYKRKIILLFDNIDDVMADEKDSVVIFLRDLLNQLEEIDNCKIRVIITSRVKLMTEDELLMRVLRKVFSKKEERLNGLLQEVELDSLTETESMELFVKCTKGNQVSISEENTLKILELCGNCPLAIRTVSDTLRYNLISASDMISNIRGSSSTDSFGVTDCLQQTFCTLDKTYQCKLMQLTVFKTAGFTTEAAMRVLNLSEPFTTKSELLYLKSRHMIEIEDLSMLGFDEEKDSDFKNRENVRYSIHPLVFKLLKGKERDALFKESIRTSKLNFLVYYESKINDIGRFQFQNFMKAQKILGDHNAHIITFYDLLRNYPHEMVTQKPGDMRSDIMFSNKRIGDLADLLLDDQKKFQLLKKWIAAAEREGDELEAIFWKIEKASKYLDMDRNEHVEAIMNDIEADLFRENENFKEDSICFVRAMFYFLRGRCLIRDFKTEEGLENLTKAEKLFKRKKMKRFYKDCLANCYNSIGSAYFKQKPEPNIKLSKEFHEKALKTASEMTNENMNCDIPAFLANIGTCLYREGQECMKFDKSLAADVKFKEALGYYDKAIRLDIQMKLHKCDIHAQKLRNRADLYAAMGNYDSALKDISDALKLRREILRSPHLQLTITMHKTGEIMRNYARELYKKDKDNSFKMTEGAKECYKETANMIKEGGIPVEHEEYPRIKHNHMDILKQLKEQNQTKIYEKFYQDFENGKFSRIGEMKRSMLETEKFRLNKEQLEMQERTCDSSSSSSSEDESSDNESTVSDDSSDNLQVTKTRHFRSESKKTNVNKQSETQQQHSSPQTGICESSSRRNVRLRKRKATEENESRECSTAKRSRWLDYCNIL